MQTLIVIILLLILNGIINIPLSIHTNSMIRKKELPVFLKEYILLGFLLPPLGFTVWLLVLLTKKNSIILKKDFKIFWISIPSLVFIIAYFTADIFCNLIVGWSGGDIPLTPHVLVGDLFLIQIFHVLYFHLFLIFYQYLNWVKIPYVFLFGFLGLLSGGGMRGFLFYIILYVFYIGYKFFFNNEKIESK